MTWLRPALLFPDAELLITQRVRAQLATRPEPYAQDVYVSNKVPDPRRARMVIVRRDGGTPIADRDRPRLSFQVWGGAEQDTTDLARLLVALLHRLPGTHGILRVEVLSGPTDVPDESGQQRRYVTAEIHVRGSAL